jgi:1-acyl-sn-glycerol-3-phosphate acyltransferase
MSRWVFHSYFRFFHAIRYRCVNNLPAHGALILTPNHVSYFDPPLIGTGIPFRARFMAWDALFRIPVFAYFISCFGAFPVKVKTADKGAIAQSLRMLRQGECLVLFPEGERTPDGSLCSFEQGAVRLALQTGAPIVPVTITGGFEAWPRTRLLPRWFRPITVKYHCPIPVNTSGSRDDVRQRVPEIMAAVERPIRRRLNAWARLKRMRGMR